MPKIHLCFLWHMHQPFYKDLVSGEYRLPWTRMHALKDYYGMVKILEEFPQVRQTFNLVPSMMVQVEEYARGEANDPFLKLALKPAEDLTDDDKARILRNFFFANPDRMIYRFPRYGELHAAWTRQDQTALARGVFGVQEFRDLQVLSQVAWFDEEFLDKDPEVRALVAKERDYSLADQALMGRKQREICAAVIPQYRKLAASGQIEISTTPFYHPILPLLCDSDIASVSHPGVPLPPRFRYPEDARLQLERARRYIETTFGVPPAGLWPSEGSVSDEALTLAADAGFKWAATDNGVLARTLNRPAGADVTYRPYKWERQGRKLGMIFRDHLLSDLIGFVYSGMDPREAAHDFLRRIRDNCAPMLAAGEDAMVPVILDGENAWEYYERGGRPFFRALYGGIQDDPVMEAITVSEAHARIKATPLDHIFPGSWISANFDVWIGAEEDNKAWRLLLAAREAYAAATNASNSQRALALEELLISEGSDWNWWYGPEHDTANAVEFDQIYREHLANVYRALDLAPPAELSQPILTIHEEETQLSPTGPISANVNGAVDSYFEWLGAGIFRVDTRQGSMHGKRTLVSEVHYGSDSRAIYLRVQFAETSESLSGVEVRISATGREEAVIRLQKGGAHSVSGDVEAAFADILEIALPSNGADSEVSLTFWQDGLPIEAVPRHGTLPIAAMQEWMG
jgi:alpha-amylase/alpha-mannosidase (GH57 family)